MRKLEGTIQQHGFIFFLEIRIQRVIFVYSLHPANKSAIKKGSSFTMFQKYDKEILQVLFLELGGHR